MPWYEWVFSGIGVFGLGLLLAFWRKSKRKGEATLTAQAAKVMDSPVASGSGITQTVTATHHHYYGQAPPPPKLQGSSEICRIIPTACRFTEVQRIGHSEFTERSGISTY